MVQRTKAALRSDINSLLPSNNPGGLSAGNLRTVLTNLVDSLVELNDDGPFTFIDTLTYNPDFSTPERGDIYHLVIPEDVKWFLITINISNRSSQNPINYLIKGSDLRNSNNEVSSWNINVPISVERVSPAVIISYGDPNSGDITNTLLFTYITDSGNKILIPYLRSLVSDRVPLITFNLYKVN